jgi:hypothetical protein
MHLGGTHCFACGSVSFLHSSFTDQSKRGRQESG